MASVAPLARSPFGEKDARALKRYQESLDKSLDNMTPWITKGRESPLRKRLLSMGVQPGETAVFLEGNDLPPSMYKDAKVIK